MESTKPTKFKAIKALKPKDGLKEFIGKQLLCMAEEGRGREMVTVETIVGSKINQTRFEINGSHQIVILDAYKQLNRDKSITQAMIDAFDEAVVEHIERIPGGIEATKPAPAFNPEEPHDEPTSPAETSH